MSTPIAFRLSGSLAALLLLPALASPQQPRSPGAPRATLAPTSVLLTIASPTTMYYGESVDGSAEVSSSDGTAPTGAITFYDGALNICTLQIAAGASCPASAGEGFAAGTHVLTAVYSGDATHAASTSNAATVTVLQDTTSALLTSSLNPATSGQNVSFTATIQGAHATPTGSVVFYDGTSPLGTSSLGATGTATLATSTLSAGTHSITAVFNAVNFTSSTSAPLSEQIQPAAISVTPSFSISVNSVSVEAGQSVAIPVVLSATTGGSITLACGNLPEEATCSFLPGSKASLVLKTSAPRDCGSTTPYGTANLSLAAPVMAGLLFLLVPRRRYPFRGLLAVMIVASALGAMAGCGTGNCTDLGTRPGTYTITVTGTAPDAAPTPVTKQIVVKVTI